MHSRVIIIKHQCILPKRQHIIPCIIISTCPTQTRRTPLTWKSTLNAAPPLSSPTRFLTITSLTRQTYRRTQTMRKRSAEEKQKQLERFLMNVAEAADAALWEYWREKEAEHRRFATEYVTRRGLIPQQ